MTEPRHANSHRPPFDLRRAWKITLFLIFVIGFAIPFSVAMWVGMLQAINP